MDYTVPKLSIRYLIVGLIMTVGIQGSASPVTEAVLNDVDARLRLHIGRAYSMGASIYQITEACGLSYACIGYVNELTAAKQAPMRGVEPTLSIAFYGDLNTFRSNRKGCYSNRSQGHTGRLRGVKLY
jgi:hypothetical protein